MRVIETKEKKRPRASLLLKIAIAAFSLYMVAALVNQQIQISAKTNQLNEIQRQFEEQDVKNEELERALSDEGSENGGYDDAYIERYAREELDFAKPGERVFVNVAGN